VYRVLTCVREGGWLLLCFRCVRQPWVLAPPPPPPVQPSCRQLGHFGEPDETAASHIHWDAWPVPVPESRVTGLADPPPVRPSGVVHARRSETKEKSIVKWVHGGRAGSMAPCSRASQVAAAWYSYVPAQDCGTSGLDGRALVANWHGGLACMHRLSQNPPGPRRAFHQNTYARPGPAFNY